MFTIVIFLLLIFTTSLGASTFTVSSAVSDPTVSPYLHRHGLVLDGISYGASGEFELDQDSALLTGDAPLLTDLATGFHSSFLLSGETDTEPSGSPKLELLASAYVDHGGLVDPSTWVYFPSISGDLVGYGNLLGQNFHLIGFGPAAQLGFGANGKNVDYGESFWFAVDGVMRGDVNVKLTQTPEPSSLILLLTGFLYLGRRKLWAVQG